MFFEREAQITEIAKKTSCSIFVIDPNTELNLKHALKLSPDTEKKSNIIIINLNDIIFV